MKKKLLRELLALRKAPKAVEEEPKDMQKNSTKNKSKKKQGGK